MDIPYKELNLPDAADRVYAFGALFHSYAKGTKKGRFSLRDTPYLAYNFQRQLLGNDGIIHNCEGLEIQDVMVELLLGNNLVDMMFSTGGDGTLAKVTTAVRKALNSMNNGCSMTDRSIDDILFLHSRAGTQEVVPAYYDLPKFWHLPFAAGVHKYRNCGKDSLRVHRVPQIKVTSSHTQNGVKYNTEDYGGMLIGACLNKFLKEHYRVSKMLEPVPHSLADLSIIGRGIVQPGYAKDFLRPVKGRIQVDGEELLDRKGNPIDGWNFLTVFSNDWNIDMKLTNLSPSMELRNHRHLPELQRPLHIVVGNATMPAVVRTVYRQARDRDWDEDSITAKIGHKVEIETEEKVFNLEGDFHRTDGKITAESGFHYSLVADGSEE